MKEAYEKPTMTTEITEGALVGQSSPVGDPIAQMQPFFGLCPPCP